MLASLGGAGFLGGIVAGFLAGYTTKSLIEKIRLPAELEALRPILVVPLLATLFTGLIMIMEDLDIGIRDLARALAVAPSTASRMVAGMTAITPEMAIKLSAPRIFP